MHDLWRTAPWCKCFYWRKFTIKAVYNSTAAICAETLLLLCTILRYWMWDTETLTSCGDDLHTPTQMGSVFLPASTILGVASSTCKGPQVIGASPPCPALLGWAARCLPRVRWAARGAAPGADGGGHHAGKSYSSNYFDILIREKRPNTMIFLHRVKRRMCLLHVHFQKFRLLPHLPRCSAETWQYTNVVVLQRRELIVRIKSKEQKFRAWAKRSWDTQQMNTEILIVRYLAFSFLISVSLLP